MKRANPDEAALLIALLLQRSQQRRARISETTLRKLSGRSHLRAVFIARVQEALMYEAGIMMQELKRGGFGLMPSDALEGAPAISLKKYMSKTSVPTKQDGADGEFDFDAIRRELNLDEAIEEDEE
jgi:hypothetical protein